LRQVGQGLSR